MSPELEDPNEGQEHEVYEEPPRSIFAATWFRAVLILIVLGVIGAVAAPYILDVVHAPSSKQAAVTSAPTPAPPSVTPPAPRAPDASGSNTRSGAPMAVPPPSLPVPATPTPEPAKPTAKATAPAAKVEAPPRSGADKSLTARRDTAGSAEQKTAAVDPSTSETKPAAKKTVEPRRVAARTPTASATGAYWVQVGAFKDEATAKGLAAKLRGQDFKVADVASRPATVAAAISTAETTPPPAGADSYDVLVSGMPTPELNTHLAAKGLAAETSATGVVIRPSLPLRDAVALSKDLAVDGFKVQVRRAGGGAGASRTAARAAAAADRAAAGGDTLYRVRVGPLADRAAAVVVLHELEAKGYKPFIGRGDR
jgi:cell division septation protein DedD